MKVQLSISQNGHPERTFEFHPHDVKDSSLSAFLTSKYGDLRNAIFAPTVETISPPQTYTFSQAWSTKVVLPKALDASSSLSAYLCFNLFQKGKMVRVLSCPLTALYRETEKNTCHTFQLSVVRQNTSTPDYAINGAENHRCVLNLMPTVGGEVGHVRLMGHTIKWDRASRAQLFPNGKKIIFSDAAVGPEAAAAAAAPPNPVDGDPDRPLKRNRDADDGVGDAGAPNTAPEAAAAAEPSNPVDKEPTDKLQKRTRVAGDEAAPASAAPYAAEPPQPYSEELPSFPKSPPRELPPLDIELDWPFVPN